MSLQNHALFPLYKEGLTLHRKRGWYNKMKLLQSAVYEELIIPCWDLIYHLIFDTHCFDNKYYHLLQK